MPEQNSRGCNDAVARIGGGRTSQRRPAGVWLREPGESACALGLPSSGMSYGIGEVVRGLGHPGGTRRRAVVVILGLFAGTAVAAVALAQIRHLGPAEALDAILTLTQVTEWLASRVHDQCDAEARSLRLVSRLRCRFPSWPPIDRCLTRWMTCTR
jgi:hypothetical protein